MSDKSDNIRGTGFESILSAQREYAKREGDRSALSLIVPEAFVRGIRDLGYRSNGDALSELIDNALQAYADRIDIVFGFDDEKSSKKPAKLAIVDNGHGMEPEMIRMAVMWGGTHRENDRMGLGRYGYGLPCASVSLGRRFEVLSKVPDGDLSSVTMDLDALTSGEYDAGDGRLAVPEAVAGEVPQFLADAISKAYPNGWHSGTIILIDKLDRLEWATAQGLRDNFCRQFGVTYHKLRGNAAIYVDDQFVEPIDPLFLTPGFTFFDSDEDRANALHPIRIEVRDPDNGAFIGTISLRYAWLPPSFGSIEKSRDAVGLNANQRFSIMKDYHGIVFSRNGRLIDVQTRTPWTSFINNDRYIKIEVEFSASLDEPFGVTTSKQQVTVSPRIWDELRISGMPKAIEQLRLKVREAKLVRRARALTPSENEQRLSVQTMIGAVSNSHSAQMGLGLPVSLYDLEFENEPGKPFFRIERSRSARLLHINMAHRFYTDIYDGQVSTAELRTSLEILLFAMGDVILEERARNDNNVELQIASWSKKLESGLNILASHIDMGETSDVGAV